VLSTAELVVPVLFASVPFASVPEVVPAKVVARVAATEVVAVAASVPRAVKQPARKNRRRHVWPNDMMPDALTLSLHLPL